MIRLTVEIGTDLPEQLGFTADEAELGIRALSYYATSELRTLEDNWDLEGLRAMTRPSEKSVEELDQVFDFVDFYRGIVKKLSETTGGPRQAIELLPQEIEALGFSLFRLGNSAPTHARSALTKNRVTYQSAEDRASVDTRIARTAGAAYQLFKQLEPIGMSKGIGWMIWNKNSEGVSA